MTIELHVQLHVYPTSLVVCVMCKLKSLNYSFGVSTRNLKQTTVCNADFKQQIKCQLQQAHGYPFLCFRMKPSNESSSYEEVQM